MKLTTRVGRILTLAALFGSGCLDETPQGPDPEPSSSDDGGTVTSADADIPSPSPGPIDMGPLESPPTVCSAATPCVYVTPSGAGSKTGVDWANAHAGLPSSGEHQYLNVDRAQLVRGTTYLFADGTYPGYIFDNAGGGNQTITLRKATVADHGTSDGWDDSLGDGEALFQSSAVVWAFAPSAKHYVFDGRFGKGKAPKGYGFRLYSTASRDEGVYMINIDATGTYDDVGDVFDITINHVELDWNNGSAAGPCGQSAGIQVHGARANGGWRIANSYVHHASGGAAYMRNGSDYTFEGNYFELMGDETESGACPGRPDHGHWETFWFTTGSGVVLKGNTFQDAYAAGQTGWVMLDASDVTISDNLFFCTTAQTCAIGGNGIIGAWSNATNTNVLIEKNTFRDLFNGAHYLFEHGSNIVIRDNTYMNAPGLSDG